MSKTILVAGGAGFIGSHLCDLLIKKGNIIISVDNLATSNKRNIKSLFKKNNFTFINGDITDSKILKKFNKLHIDQIYHLASPASVTYVTQYPVETADTNSIGTKNLLEIAKDKKARLLFASSSEVYGDPKEHPQNEAYWGNTNSTGVRSGYDEGKRFGEALCMAYHREYGVETRITRIFNTYGPNSSEKDTRIIPQLIRQALKNEPLTVHGDGSQTRSFCYVTDTAEGLIKVMESKIFTPFNIGSPDEYKVLDVAKIILKLTKSKSTIAFTRRPEDDPSVRKPDIAKAKKELTWTPQIPFKEGLLETINYFKEILPVKQQ